MTLGEWQIGDLRYQLVVAVAQFVAVARLWQM